MFKKRFAGFLLFAMIFAFIISICGCGGGSGGGGSSTNPDNGVLIGPDGGTIRLESAQGSPEVTFPPGALKVETTVRMTELDQAGYNSRSDMETSCPFLLEIDDAQVSSGGYITIRFNRTPPTGYKPGIGQYKDGVLTIHNASMISGGIQGNVSIETGRAGYYRSEFFAADIPEDGGGSAPDLTVYRLENEEWVEDETAWSGSKIALAAHGFTKSPESMRALAVHVKDSQGYDNVYAVHYPVGHNIDSTGQVLSEIIKNRLPSGSEFHIFGHSMGGLVSRSAIENHNTADKVDKLITMGTPHNGVASAFLYTLMFNGFFTGGAPEVEDMTPGSDFLNNLNNGVPVDCRYYSAAGTDSEELTPYWTVKLLGVDTVSDLLGESVHDGMVAASSAGHDVSAECIYWESESFPVSHQYIRGGDYGSPLYNQVLQKADEWIGQ